MAGAYAIRRKYGEHYFEAFLLLFTTLLFGRLFGLFRATKIVMYYEPAIGRGESRSCAFIIGADFRSQTQVG